MDDNLYFMTDIDPELDKMATEILQEIENEAEALLRKNFEVKTYTDPDEINRIYKLLFGFYEEKFEEYLRPVPIVDLLSFMLKQYEDYFGGIHKGEPMPKDIPNAFSDPPSAQKALLYCMERALVNDNTAENGLDDDDFAIHCRALELCATRMCDWAVCSDQIHGVYKNDTTVEILPPGGLKFFLSRITPELRDAMNEIDTAVDQENIARRELLEGNDLPMDLDERRRVLDPVLKAELGVTFEEKRKILNSFVKEPFDNIHIVPAEKVIDLIEVNTGFSRPLIKQIIDGLLITKDKIKGDNPIWLINARDNRITRRPIMGIELPDGFHYAWARGMTSEILNYFNGLMIFRGFPPEWCTAPVQKAVEDLSGSVSQWFEDEYSKLMKPRGFVGRRVNGSIGNLSVPIGEVDYLSFNSDMNLLLVSECKLVKWSSDPRQCYDDYKQFVDTEKTKKKSYSEILKEKFDWVTEHAKEVVQALQSEFPEIKFSEPIRVASILVTYHPMRVSLLVKNVACKSLVTFIKDLDDNGDWTYEEGIRQA